MEKTEPKIVFWDLETLPDPRKIYDRIPSIGAWPGRTFKAQLQSILCFGYKIAGEDKAHSINAWDFDGFNENRHDDSAVVHAAYEVLHDADEIVTHNGKRFDVKVLNTRLLKYGLPPLPKINHVDTKQVAKRSLSLYSNSLAEVAKFLNVSEKMHWNDKWSTWTNIAFGTNKADDLRLMDEYCKQDVDTLEQVYLKLRAFHGNDSVNKNHWISPDNLACPTCGSTELMKNGVRRSKTQVYQRYICGSCGTSSRTDKNDANPRGL